MYVSGPYLCDIKGSTSTFYFPLKALRIPYISWNKKERNKIINDSMHKNKQIQKVKKNKITLVLLHNTMFPLPLSGVYVQSAGDRNSFSGLHR